MRHIILLLFLIATCKMVCLAQRSDLTRLPADLDNFRDSITKYHAHPFRYISPGQFRTTIDSLKRLSPKLFPEALYVGLLELASEMEDEHFSFAHKQRPFSFAAHWFKEGIYLIAADEPDMIFSKIIGVEQYSVDSVLQGFKKMVPTENKSLFKKQAAAYLSNPVILYGMGIIGNRDSVHLVLEKENGDTVTRIFTIQSDSVNLNVFAARKEMMRFDNRGNYWYDILMPQRVLYLNYSRCVEDANRPFSAMYWEMIPKISKYSIHKVVIDLRLNGGGSDLVIQQLINYLAAAQKKDSIAVDVLIGRHTFSAAVNSAFYLGNEVAVRYIGEETGGNINHFGHVGEFRLPASGIKVRYSRRYLQRKKGAVGGIKPDVFIPESVADLQRGYDAALEYALAH